MQPSYNKFLKHDRLQNGALQIFKRTRGWLSAAAPTIIFTLVDVLQCVVCILIYYTSDKRTFSFGNKKPNKPSSETANLYVAFGPVKSRQWLPYKDALMLRRRLLNPQSRIGNGLGFYVEASPSVSIRRKDLPNSHNTPR
ncbi:MAG: hypothetical protein GY820_03625 [Gammaproteobacteria bacterium]|nr:hypothetical protein [Gammaproteobacteria bacterium]